MSEDMPDPWPTGDVAPERFYVKINEDRSVTLFDGKLRVKNFWGPDALADALAARLKLTEQGADGGTAPGLQGMTRVTPTQFLTETLPAYARTQRLENMLAEVRTAETAALAGLTDAINLLNRAISLRERLEKSLETATRPLSAPESAEQTSVVGRGTPHFNRLRGEAAKLHLLPHAEDSDPGGGLNKPQPY
jgi:hypothetical protein